MTSSPAIIPRSAHSISRGQISEAALHVLYTLKDAGYDSYLVGGCVRDLMLGHEPKDFDVVTNALPEEVRPLFRRAQLIGRRFRLVHVRHGRDIIEVATYRGEPEDDEESEGVLRSSTGRILRDNVYGSQEEDAVRRDFTVNALYYNIKDFSVIDYVGGAADLNEGYIRMIGAARQRYREDPVRMLRAMRFMVKLGFRLAPETADPIAEMAPLLQDVPPARLFEEVLKLFHSGRALETFEQLRHYGLFEYIFPVTNALLDSEQHESAWALIPLALTSTDDRIGQGKPVNPAFLFAVMLWPSIWSRLKQGLEQGMHTQDALRLSTNEVLAKQLEYVAIPRRLTTIMREIWALQFRLEHRTRKRAYRVFEHPRFRAAYDFLCLRERANEIEPGLCEWWTRFQEVGQEERDALIQQQQAGAPGKRRKRRRRKKKPDSS